MTTLKQHGFCLPGSRTQIIMKFRQILDINRNELTKFEADSDNYYEAVTSSNICHDVKFCKVIYPSRMSKLS